MKIAVKIKTPNFTIVTHLRKHNVLNFIDGLKQLSCNKIIIIRLTTLLIKISFNIK